MWLYSTTVAGAAPESDRLPVLPEPALAGSPVGSHTVGKAGGDVKKGAVLCRLAIGIAVMPHSEFLAAALDAARAADDVVRHYYQRNLKITIKADKSPVTEADVETEKAIRSLLAARFPAHGFHARDGVVAILVIQGDHVDPDPLETRDQFGGGRFVGLGEPGGLLHDERGGLALTVQLGDDNIVGGRRRERSVRRWVQQSGGVR